MRGSLSVSSLSFSPIWCNTAHYSRCFIAATTKSWNDLTSMIVEAAELQKFNLGANASYLEGMDCSLLYVPQLFFLIYSFNILLGLDLVLLNPLLLLYVFVVVFMFYFLTGLVSLLGLLAFWCQVLPAGVCSLECDNDNYNNEINYSFGKKSNFLKIRMKNEILKLDFFLQFFFY